MCERGEGYTYIYIKFFFVVVMNKEGLYIKSVFQKKRGYNIYNSFVNFQVKNKILLHVIVGKNANDDYIKMIMQKLQWKQ